jgi:hypothetical protein
MNNFPEVAKAVGDDVAFREFSDSMFEKLAVASMTPLQIMDGLMRSTTAAGAYLKIMNEMGIPVDLANPNQLAIERATQLMRQSQGSSFFLHQPLPIPLRQER